MKKLIIAIDFDGTIVEDCYPEIGKPICQAFDAILHFKACGYKLILWTCRENTPERNYLNEAVAFCAARGVVFDAVNENTPDNPYNLLGKSRKVYADRYIDDKALLPHWEAYSGGIIESTAEQINRAENSTECKNCGRIHPLVAEFGLCGSCATLIYDET